MFSKILILAAIVGISSAVVYDFDSKTSKLDPTKSLNCLFFHAEFCDASITSLKDFKATEMVMKSNKRIIFWAVQCDLDAENKAYCRLKDVTRYPVLICYKKDGTAVPLPQKRDSVAATKAFIESTLLTVS